MYQPLHIHVKSSGESLQNMYYPHILVEETETKSLSILLEAYYW